MKAITTISTMILAAGVAVGQAAPAKKPAAPASQSSTTKTTMATPAKSSASKPATKPTTMAAKPATKPAKQAAAKPAAAKVAPAAKPAPTKTELSKGKRDPFISPVIVRMGGDSGPSCSTGKRCLVIDQLLLEGVVKTQNGWIAVIGNQAKKVYYLRENDALFDGFVKRIAGDSIVFQQNITDNLGRSTQREVVRRITPST
jgi:Tfp pilus assembly protein PilP